MTEHKWIKKVLDFGALGTDEEWICSVCEEYGGKTYVYERVLPTHCETCKQALPPPWKYTYREDLPPNPKNKECKNAAVA